MNLTVESLHNTLNRPVGPVITRHIAGRMLVSATLPSRGRVVVVSPHPDDETLGAGGTIADLSLLGWDVRIVIVTDGAASHLDVPELAADRRREACRAARELGTTSEPLFLDLPDGQVANVRETLATSLRVLIDDCVLVIGPRSGDGHPDHEATAEALIEAISGIPEGRRPQLWRYAIWAWEWQGITPDDLDGARTWQLSPAARQRRASALAAYRSQLSDQYGTPIVPVGMVAEIELADEVFWC